MRLEWNGNKPLTKIKALYICWKLWEWLAKTGSDDKKIWPGWEKINHCSCSCPCCEYVNHNSKNGKSCRLCPLIKLWPDHCTHPESIFVKWCRNISPGRKKYALIIANFAKKEYQKEAKKSKRR